MKTPKKIESRSVRDTEIVHQIGSTDKFLVEKYENRWGKLEIT